MTVSDPGFPTLDVIAGALVAILVAMLMEPWARLLHGKVWHRWLFSVHRSHHEPRLGRFERNDALSILHAPIAIVLIAVGCQLQGLVRALLVGAGAGMTLFGLGYFIVHDGLVHERLPVSRLLRSRIFRRIRGAHLVHHRTGGPPFGLFLGFRELRRFQRARSAQAQHPSAPSGSARAPSSHRGRRADASSPCDAERRRSPERSSDP